LKEAPRRCIATACRSAQYAIFLEPGDHLLPAILGGVLIVAWPVIGNKSVRRAGIFMKLRGLAGGLEGCLHLLDLIRCDARVGFAIETEHGLLHLRRKLDRALWRGVALVDQAAVERDAGFQVGIVRRVVPDVTAAAAE